jgi:hypothetical protein
MNEDLNGLKWIDIQDCEDREESNSFLIPLKTFAGFGYNKYCITVLLNTILNDRESGEVIIFQDINEKLSEEDLRRITIALSARVIEFRCQFCSGDYILILKDEIEKILIKRGHCGGG